MKPLRLLSMAQEFRDDPRRPDEDAIYLERCAMLIENTTNNHGPNGVGGIVDDKCPVCLTVLELQKSDEAERD